jgi:hypothetical protein
VGIAILFWAIVLGGAAVHLWGVFSSP